MINNYFIFVDYEGTLSEPPVGSGVNQTVLLSDLLFNDVFSELKPKENVKRFLLKQNTKNIYVLGIVDTNQEIKQKEQWLKQNYNFIPVEHYIFVSSEHQKVEIINEFAKRFNLQPSEILFIDDKQKHLDSVREMGYRCLDANEIAI